MKKLILGTLVAFFGCLGLSNRANASDLKFTIAADPKNPAGIIFTFADSNGADIQILDEFGEATFGSFFTFTLTGDLGAPVTDLGISTDGPPHHQGISVLCLQRAGEKLVLDINVLRLLKSVSPGKYSLTITYHNAYDDDGGRIFHGSLDSNTIDLVVPDKPDTVAAASPFLISRTVVDPEFPSSP